MEPIHLDVGPHDAAFASAFGPVVGAEFIDGNSVEILVNGDRFFPAMLKAIREAQKTITFETYIWAPGKISDEFIVALTERAQHGVKVHVLVDGMGTLKFKKEDGVRLRAAGVELLKYGREHWYEIKPNINHRTHRKLLIVDGRIAFTGGMCIDDSWLGNADSEKVWRETGARIAGPVVRQMQAVFAANWLQTTSALLLGEDYFPKISSSGSSLAQCFGSGPDEGAEMARIGYLFAIAGARQSIDLSHAYFVPDDLAIKMLLAARKRGVRIRAIVPAINDSRFGRAASRSRWGELLEAGVEFHQYLPAMYHCKTMVVDGVFVTIGSANFDNRSFTINDEVTLNVLDRGVAADHLRMFEQDLRRSKPLTLEEFKARPFYIKAADHIAGMFRSQL
ncbi:MAG: phospholipase D-like domain-containing protein [Opitutaceae bacterium]